jgi:hypothetical protein
MCDRTDDQGKLQEQVYYVILMQNGHFIVNNRTSINPNDKITDPIATGFGFLIESKLIAPKENEYYMHLSERVWRSKIFNEPFKVNNDPIFKVRAQQ